MTRAKPEKNTICVWHPQQMAYEALECCGDMLENGHIRQSVRAAHDSMHCSLVLLLHGEMGREGHPYAKPDKLLEHLRDRKSESVIEFTETDSKKLLSVLSTRRLLEASDALKSPPRPSDNAEILIDIRDSIEHPKPGVTGWDICKCLEAITGGVAVAEWALRYPGSGPASGDDRTGLGLLLGRIRKCLQCK